MKILNNHIFKRKQAKNSAAKILNNSMFRRKQGQVLVGFDTELKGKQKYSINVFSSASKSKHSIILCSGPSELRY